MTTTGTTPSEAVVAGWSDQRLDEALDAIARRALHAEDMRRVPLAELDRRVREAGAAWEELLDRLTAAGTPPPPGLHRRLRLFLDHGWWRGEEARVEVLRRRTIDDTLHLQPSAGPAAGMGR
jgi:hypothetical protein